MKKRNAVTLGVMVTALICAAIAGGCDIYNPVIDDWWVGPEGVGGIRTQLNTPIKFYTITFESNGGDYIDLVNAPNPNTTTDNPWPQYILQGRRASEPGLVTWAGHFLSGWYTTQAAANDPNNNSTWDFNKAPSGDMTLYAGWESSGKTIKFYENPPVAHPDLTWTNCTYEPLDELIATDSQLTEPKQFGLKVADSLAGTYFFDGWYTDSSCTGEPWNFLMGSASNAVDTLSDGPTADGTIKLYAKWSLQAGTTVYNVTFDSGGADGGAGAVPPAQHIPTGGKVSQPNALTKEDYVFTGWYANGSSTPYDFTTGVTGTLNLVAKWEPRPYSDPWFKQLRASILTRADDSNRFYLPFQISVPGGYDYNVDAAGVDYTENQYYVEMIRRQLVRYPEEFVRIIGYKDNSTDPDALITQRELQTAKLFIEAGINANQVVINTALPSGYTGPPLPLPGVIMGQNKNAGDITTLPHQDEIKVIYYIPYMPY